MDRRRTEMVFWIMAGIISLLVVANVYAFGRLNSVVREKQQIEEQFDAYRVERVETVKENQGLRRVLIENGVLDESTVRYAAEHFDVRMSSYENQLSRGLPPTEMEIAEDITTLSYLVQAAQKGLVMTKEGVAGRIDRLDRYLDSLPPSEKKANWRRSLNELRGSLSSAGENSSALFLWEKSHSVDGLLKLCYNIATKHNP